MLTKPTLAAWDYPSILLGMIRMTIHIAIISIIKAPFRGRDGAPTYRRHVLYAAMRSFVECFSTRQLQALLPTTREAYESLAKNKGFAPEVVDLGDVDTVGCWIGNPGADVVMMWFHGGGYALMATSGHMEFLYEIVVKINDDDNGGNRGAKGGRKGGGGGRKRIAVFVPQYDVVPHATYPRQLEQAIMALRYLTQDLGKSYSQLIIAGDSAGGHLALSLLNHLSSPPHHPDNPALSLIPDHPNLNPNHHHHHQENKPPLLLGALLLSPMVTFAQTSPSYRANLSKDCISPAVVRRWTDALLLLPIPLPTTLTVDGRRGGDGDGDDVTADTAAALSSWQFDLMGAADRVLVLAGADEVFIDDILSFVEEVKKQKHNNHQHTTNADIRLEVLVAEGEPHNPPILERQLGIRGRGGGGGGGDGGPGLVESRLLAWVADRVRGV
ncbi:Alpha/Beta hydrolase protein [Xylariomycetidae sp. FL2044]|nr:Alpha/Beta hydrolase protein [Xylariomycetidae sp. FL2044]